MEPLLTFEEALAIMKAGGKTARAGWNNSEILVRVQFPDEGSMNTEPYLVMEKRDKCFPLDLSCESIFAEDWVKVK